MGLIDDSSIDLILTDNFSTFSLQVGSGLNLTIICNTFNKTRSGTSSSTQQMIEPLNWANLFELATDLHLFSCHLNGPIVWEAKKNSVAIFISF